MTMADPIQPEQPRREFKNYSGILQPCSPDLAPSDFRVFGLLKYPLGGKYFADEKRWKRVRKWLKQQLKDFISAGFDVLITQ
jgi:hypothetical protein